MTHSNDSLFAGYRSLHALAAEAQDGETLGQRKIRPDSLEEDFQPVFGRKEGSDLSIIAEAVELRQSVEEQRATKSDDKYVMHNGIQKRVVSREEWKKTHKDFKNPKSMVFGKKPTRAMQGLGRDGGSFLEPVYVEGLDKGGIPESIEEGRGGPARKQKFMSAFMDALDDIDPSLSDDSSEWGAHATNAFNKGVDPKVAAAKYAKSKAKRKRKLGERAESIEEGSLDEAVLKTGLPETPAIGYERGAYWYQSKNGAKHGPAVPPGKRKDREYARLKFRYMLTNEAGGGMGGAKADKLIAKLDAMAESIEEAKGTVKITVKKKDGEWAACYYLNGKFQEGPTYYAGDDKEDAESTAKEMRKEAAKKGYVVEGVNLFRAAVEEKRTWQSKLGDAIATTIEEARGGIWSDRKVSMKEVEGLIKKQGWMVVDSKDLDGEYYIRFALSGTRHKDDLTPKSRRMTIENFVKKHKLSAFEYGSDGSGYGFMSFEKAQWTESFDEGDVNLFRAAVEEKSAEQKAFTKQFKATKGKLKLADMSDEQKKALFAKVKKDWAKNPDNKPEESIEESQQIAKTILQQLGGQKRLAMMTGAKDFVWDEKTKTLMFKIGRNAKGVNKVRITLRNDLYDVEFGAVRGASYKVKAKERGIYNDMLVPAFEEHTGMYLSLTPRESIEEAAPIDQRKLLALYNGLKKGDTVDIVFDSTMSKGNSMTFVVMSPHRVVGKAKVGRIIFKSVKNLKGVKYFWYNRDGEISMAQGDMGVSMISAEKSTSESTEESVEEQWYVPDSIRVMSSNHPGDNATTNPDPGAGNLGWKQEGPYVGPVWAWGDHNQHEFSALVSWPDDFGGSPHDTSGRLGYRYYWGDSSDSPLTMVDEAGEDDWDWRWYAGVGTYGQFTNDDDTTGQTNPWGETYGPHHLAPFAEIGAAKNLGGGWSVSGGLEHGLGRGDGLRLAGGISWGF